MALVLRNPQTSEEIAQRNHLLQTALRHDTGASYPIASEYPTVLDPNRTQWSWCAFRDDQCIAHANLLPRREVGADASGATWALIGNVATAPHLQGKGIMREVLTQLTAMARASGHEGILLWSDLTSFYQKLGFEQVGRECRVQFVGQVGEAEAGVQTTATLIRSKRDLSDHDIGRLLDLRNRARRRLECSPCEFKNLLTIPELDLYVAGEGETWTGFGVVGKGCDMRGVLHDWSTATYQDLAIIATQARRDLGLEAICVIGPDLLFGEWFRAWESHRWAHSLQVVPMAWMLSLGAAATPPFVWGLDSI